MIISYDNGMSNGKLFFKYKDKEYEIDFNSRVKELESEAVDCLVINGKYYTFNEGRIAAQLGHNAKDNDVHRILLYKAMYEAYKVTGETKFDIITNCSLDSYKIDEGKSVMDVQSKFKEIKIKEGFVNKEVKFTINQIIVLPECLSGSLTTDLKLKEEDVVVIDIGSKNIQLLQISQGRVQYDTSYATRYGMNNILMGSADLVKVHEPMLKSSDAIQMYLEKTNNGSFGIINEVDELILRYLMTNIFTEIDERLNEMDIKLFTKYVFLGGGSIALKRFLEAKFEGKSISFVKNPYFANARGLYMKGVKMINKSKSKNKVG